MATQRYISTSFWDDKWICELDPSEKLLYMYLMTNPLTNISGIYKITKRRISFDTGFNTDTVGKILKRFTKDKKAFLFNDEYMILPTWPKHQQWEKRSKIKNGIDSALKELPAEVLKYAKEIGYRYPIDTVSIPYVYDSNYSEFEFDSEFDSDYEGDINHQKDTGYSDNPDFEKDSPPSPDPLKLKVLDPDEEITSPSDYPEESDKVPPERHLVIPVEFHLRLNDRLALTTTPDPDENKRAKKLLNDIGSLDLIIKCLDAYFDDSIDWYFTRKSRSEPDRRVYRFKTFCTVITDLISHVRDQEAGSGRRREAALVSGGIPL